MLDCASIGTDDSQYPKLSKSFLKDEDHVLHICEHFKINFPPRKPQRECANAENVFHWCNVTTWIDSFMNWNHLNCKLDDTGHFMQAYKCLILVSLWCGIHLSSQLLPGGSHSYQCADNTNKSRGPIFQRGHISTSTCLHQREAVSFPLMLSKRWCV